jgi:hypothetical protein
MANFHAKMSGETCKLHHIFLKFSGSLDVQRAIIVVPLIKILEVLSEYQRHLVL